MSWSLILNENPIEFSKALKKFAEDYKEDFDPSEEDEDSEDEYY